MPQIENVTQIIMEPKMPGTKFFDKNLSRKKVPGIASRKLVKGGNRRNLSK
jgi:hypothetical protein